MKLQLSNIQKSFGAKTVLAGANFQVRDNEKIALVGRNGCGKTTLMKIICGQENYDSGSRMVLNGTNIGYLAQITFVDEEKTVYEELLTAFDKVRELEKQLNEQAEVLKTDSSEKQLAKYREKKALWNNVAVGRILANEQYTGTMVYLSLIHISEPTRPY